MKSIDKQRYVIDNIPYDLKLFLIALFDSSIFHRLVFCFKILIVRKWAFDQIIHDLNDFYREEKDV